MSDGSYCRFCGEPSLVDRITELEAAIQDALKNWWPAEDGDYRYDKSEHEAKARLKTFLKEQV